jgi:phosphohistidine phosphatase
MPKRKTACPILERAADAQGRKQAERVAQWLLQRLPARFVLVASPAVRAQQTAEALGVRSRPTARSRRARRRGAREGLRLAGYKGAAVIVGHQPDLGRALAELLGAHGGFSLKKGGLWWISNRVRDEKDQVVVRAVVSPDLL